MYIFCNLLKMLFLFLVFSCSSAHAERRQIQYSAASGQQSWKLENYMGDGVVLWNTPSSCDGGLISLPSNMTTGDKNRLYATLIAAKTSNSTMFIYYDDTPRGGLLISFGLL